MRIGIFGAAVNEGTIDQVIGEVRDAEAGGFSSYWAPQIFGHDALTALALAGREVPRIELGTSVVPTFPRHPIALAQQALTVKRRAAAVSAWASACPTRSSREHVGLPFNKPVRHLRDYLDGADAAAPTGRSSFDGEDLPGCTA